MSTCKTYKSSLVFFPLAFQVRRFLSLVFGFGLFLSRLHCVTVSGVDVSLSLHMILPMLRLFGLVVYPSGLGLLKSLVLWLFLVSCFSGVSATYDQSISSSFNTLFYLIVNFCLPLLGYCFRRYHYFLPAFVTDDVSHYERFNKISS